MSRIFWIARKTFFCNLAYMLAVADPELSHEGGLEILFKKYSLMGGPTTFSSQNSPFLHELDLFLDLTGALYPLLLSDHPVLSRRAAFARPNGKSKISPRHLTGKCRRWQILTSTPQVAGVKARGWNSISYECRRRLCDEFLKLVNWRLRDGHNYSTAWRGRRKAGLLTSTPRRCLWNSTPSARIVFKRGPRTWNGEYSHI